MKGSRTLLLSSLYLLDYIPKMSVTHCSANCSFKKPNLSARCTVLDSKDLKMHP